MTGLSAYVPERAEVKTKSTTFSVRGLALVDVTRLISLHLADIEQVVARWENVKAQVYSRQASDELFFGIANDFPDLVAEVISVAADEPEALDVARTLPVGVQVHAMETIIRLTFEEAGGIKNLFASLAKAVRAMLPVELKARLANLVKTTAGSMAPLLSEDFGDSDKT